MSNTKPSYPRFIQNFADGDDKFPEKGQDKLAHAIGQLIQHKEQKSKIIGLEGDWGSGKSNVIRMVRKNLKETHHFYIHDVWSYQEDLQRRSFLESLTKDLCRDGDAHKPFLQDTKKWRENLRELLARKKETTVDVIPVFSPGFLFVLCLIAAWTFLKEFAGPITIAWGGEIHPNSYVIIGAILGYLWFCRNAKKWLGPRDIFYLYNEKDTKKVTNETIFEDEPSVDRFQDWLTKLQNDFPQNKELVVVFDNMDRLPKEKVKQIWSLIHTFFSEICFEKIWVIVPYSRDQLTRAFDGNSDETDHFIDKTFTIQYNVPPPIMSDWKHFFRQVYTEVFGENENGEFPVVQTIFDRLNDKITPRKIIIFFNEIVALKKVWQEEIKLRYIALYALCKREILKNPTEEILNRRFLGKTEPVFVNDEQLIDSISALIYNIPIQSAGQIALKQELRTLLRNGRKENIEEFAKLPFFLELLENIVLEEGNSANGFELVLDSISAEQYETLDPGKMQNIWNIIGSNYWARREVDQKFIANDKVILKRIDANKRQQFINKLTDNMRSIREDLFSGKDYYEALNELEKYIKDEELSGLNFEGTLKPVKLRSEALLDFLSMAEKGNSDYKRYNVSADSTELNVILNQKNLTDLKQFESIRQLKGDSKYDLAEFRKGLKQKIRTDELNSENISEATLIYKSLNYSRPIPPFIAPERIDQFLPQLTKKNPGYYELLALRLRQSLDSEVPAYLTSMETEENVVGLSNVIFDYISVNDAFGYVSGNQSSFLNKIVIYCVKNPSEWEKSKHEFDSINVLPNLIATSEILAIQPSELLDFLNKSNSEDYKKAVDERLLELINNEKSLMHIVNQGNEMCRYVVSSAIQFLEKLSENDWLIKMKEANSLEFAMLCYLIGNEELSFSPPEGMSRAYRTALFDFSKGEFSIQTESIPKWISLFHKLDRRHLTAPLKDIRDRFLSPENPMITPEQFKLFGAMFVEMDVFSEHFGGICRRILTPVIVDPVVLNSQILVNPGYYMDVISRAGDDADLLIENLRNMSEADPENLTLNEFIESLDKLMP